MGNDKLTLTGKRQLKKMTITLVFEVCSPSRLKLVRMTDR